MFQKIYSFAIRPSIERHTAHITRLFNQVKIIKLTIKRLSELKVPPASFFHAQNQLKLLAPGSSAPDPAGGAHDAPPRPRGRQGAGHVPSPDLIFVARPRRTVPSLLSLQGTAVEHSARKAKGCILFHTSLYSRKLYYNSVFIYLFIQN